MAFPSCCPDKRTILSQQHISPSTLDLVPWLCLPLVQPSMLPGTPTLAIPYSWQIQLPTKIPLEHEKNLTRATNRVQASSHPPALRPVSRSLLSPETLDTSVWHAESNTLMSRDQHKDDRILWPVMCQFAEEDACDQWPRSPDVFESDSTIKIDHTDLTWKIEQQNFGCSLLAKKYPTTLLYVCWNLQSMLQGFDVCRWSLCLVSL